MISEYSHSSEPSSDSQVERIVDKMDTKKVYVQGMCTRYVEVNETFMISNTQSFMASSV